jgi:phosphatidylglycerol:prolipoprotein diacylglycerol transferase
MYPAFGSLTWITPYGLMLVVALFSCWLYARRRALVFGLDVSHVDLAVPLVFAVSLLGAEFLSIISPRDTEFAGQVLQSHSRFRLFGLLLIGVPALFAFSRLTNISFRVLLDLFALPVLLWLALIRVGCFMAGCCWGDLTQEYPGMAAIEDPQLSLQVLTLPWFSGDWIPYAVSFPPESLAYQQHLAFGLIEPGNTSSLPVHPTQLYELVLIVLLLVVLRHVECRQVPAGMLALLALGGYSMLRFFIEFLRADNPLMLGSLSFHQLISIALLLACTASTPFTRRVN